MHYIMLWTIDKFIKFTHKFDDNDKIVTECRINMQNSYLPQILWAYDIEYFCPYYSLYNVTRTAY